MPEAVLSHEPKVLSQSEREAYFENGYLVKKKLVDDKWINRLRDVTEAMIEESRNVSVSNSKFDLEDGHTSEFPKLRRLTQPVEHHQTYWEFTTSSIITDLAEDLLGPDIMFHHSKLNFKWFGGGEEVKWHQDIQFWPHTNFSVLTIGVYLDHVDDDTAPMGVIPDSHRGPIYNQYNEQNEWVGCLNNDDVHKAKPQNAVYLKGPAGSVTVHHCRMIHGSKSNNHPKVSRPLLLNAFSSADALPITPNPTPSRFNGKVIRGQPAKYAEFDSHPVRLPPDWSEGYSSIFALQQEEVREEIRK